MHALLKTGNKHITGNGFSGNPLAKVALVPGPQGGLWP